MFLRPLTDQAELVLGFSQAKDGTMSLNGGFDNRQAYLATHGLEPQRVVHAGLSHGTRIVHVTAANGGQIIPDTDGLITTEANVGLAITAADCLLVYVLEPRSKTIALVHAGRRGLADGILVTLVRQLRTLHLRPGHLILGISPSICAEHYPVQRTDAKSFTSWPEACQAVGDRIHLDLRLVARRQLEVSGVPSENITIDPRCTFEHDDLFSYRRDQPAKPQLQIGYLMRRF